MVTIPNAGVAVSVTEHNSELQVCADWIEFSVIFLNDGVSKTDIVDILIEENIYVNQDFANQWVECCFEEIRRRNKLIGTASPLRIERNRIEPISRWQDSLAYFFCLFLSLLPYHSDIRNNQRKTKGGYNKQGELFEMMTLESLQKQLENWRFFKTGWSRSNPAGIKAIVEKIAQLLGEQQGQLEPWVTLDTKDAGLDLLCYRPFKDGRVGIPVYLLQCASGQDWTSKTHTPDLNIWTKMVQFAATPKKAFATPFALEEKQFTSTSNMVDGMLLDRYRLIVPDLPCKDWLSNETVSKLEEWLNPRIPSVPSY